MTASPEHTTDAVRWRDDPDPASPGRTRRTLATVLSEWGFGSDIVADAQMIATELVTNVVDHARTPFEVEVCRLPGRLRIAVRDSCPRPPRKGPRDPRAPRGRGLLMVDAISDRWGYLVNDSGKIVSAEVCV